MGQAYRLAEPGSPNTIVCEKCAVRAARRAANNDNHGTARLVVKILKKAAAHFEGHPGPWPGAHVAKFLRDLARCYDRD